MLTYCIGALALPQRKVGEFGVCWKNSFRKIFKYDKWEFVLE